jgi:hypothetical protein
MDGGQLKNVCLLSVVCLSVTSSSPIIFWTVGLIGIKKNLKKLEKMCIWEFQSWSSGVNNLELRP